MVSVRVPAMITSPLVGLSSVPIIFNKGGFAAAGLADDGVKGSRLQKPG